MADGSPLTTKAALLERLRGEIERREAGGPERSAPAATPTGIGPLDRLLPGGGLPAGCLADWASTVEGGGAWTLALLAAGGICRDGRLVAIVDPVSPGAGSHIYPPGLAALVPLNRVILVRPAGRVRVVWALEQCLRCPAIGAVLAGPAPADRLDGIAGRRLAHAAEVGGGVGFLIRPSSGPVPAAASVRVRIEPLASPDRSRRFRLDLERARGLAAPAAIDVEVHLETGHMSALGKLSDTAADRSAG